MTSTHDERLRVMHVTSSLALGGANEGVLELARLLEKSGRCDVSLCVLSADKQFVEATGLSSPPLFLGYSRSAWDVSGMLRCAGQLRRAMHEFRPHILHTHRWLADITGAIACIGGTTKHVCHIRDTREWLVSKRWNSRLRRIAYRTLLAASGGRCIAVSNAVKQYTCQHLGWSADRIQVIMNGISVERFADDGDSSVAYATGAPIVLGTAGRFAPEKGFEHLLKALAILRNEDVDYRLRIAGGGSPYRVNVLRKVAQELGVVERINFVGSVTDMPSFYRSIDIFVLASVAAEGLPRVVLEAMAAGKPVVATNVAGTPEALRDGMEGLLVPPGDAEALAGAIRRLAREPDLATRLATAARARVRRDFTAQRVAAEVLILYECLLDHPDARRAS